jgi:hypothetical protein
MKFLLAIILLFFSVDCIAANPNLIGKWRSDRELTMSFIKKNVKLEPKREKFLQDIMGRLTITFNKTNVISVLPDVEVTIEGKKHNMVGFTENSTYKVVAANRNVIVVSEKENVSGRQILTTYNFESDDVIWVYTGGADRATSDSHYREYFRRVR